MIGRVAQTIDLGGQVYRATGYSFRSLCEIAFSHVKDGRTADSLCCAAVGEAKMQLQEAKAMLAKSKKDLGAAPPAAKGPGAKA